MPALSTIREVGRTATTGFPEKIQLEAAALFYFDVPDRHARKSKRDRIRSCEVQQIERER